MKAPHFLILILVTVALALPVHGSSYDPYAPDTKNLEGVWALDNSRSRRPDEIPIWKRLTIYATHMEFCPGQGTVGTEGEWKDGSFWCASKDGSGKIEAAKIISPDEIELHLAAFYPDKKDVVILYKQQGGDQEKPAVVAQPSQTVSYPPPQGTIKEGMSEYELTKLPWKADKVIPGSGESKDDDATIYCYHSDNAALVELRVTVKDHKVIAVNGGNG